MTGMPSFMDRIAAFKALLWFASILCVAMTAASSLMLAGAWAIYGADLISSARRELGIELLAAQVKALSGEDRVIRQPRGLSYVNEPAHQGEPVTVILTLARTQLGMPCDFVGGRAIFEDKTGIPNAGGAVAVSRQITTDPTRLRFQVDQPAAIALVPGRVFLYISLDYQCGGRRITESTDPMWFQLLAGRAP